MARKQGPAGSDDPVNPRHYRDLKPEPIEVIESWGLPFHLGNVLKYLARFRAKDGLQDLKKSLWYLERYIAFEEKHLASGEPETPRNHAGQG